MPKKIALAHVPTPIEKIQFMEMDLPLNLYLKRDDLTGIGMSGNKVRKLDYLLEEAISTGVTDLITCGAIQSNHCRSSALAASKLGLNCHLLLAGSQETKKEGNNFLSLLAGAEQRYIEPQEFEKNHREIMDAWKIEIEKDPDKKVMVIPLGASCGLGSFGYADCYEEILTQEKEMNLSFDAIVISLGSGGSLAGLVYGRGKSETKKEIVGISVSPSQQEAKEQMVLPILAEMSRLDGGNSKWEREDFTILDSYVGQGYGKSTIEELEFIRDFISQTGIILDPVYTGKGVYGLINEILKGRWEKGKNILFIHTGGAFGWTRDQIDRLLSL